MGAYLSSSGSLQTHTHRHCGHLWTVWKNHIGDLAQDSILPGTPVLEPSDQLSAFRRFETRCPPLPPRDDDAKEHRHQATLPSAAAATDPDLGNSGEAPGEEWDDVGVGGRVELGSYRGRVFGGVPMSEGLTGALAALACFGVHGGWSKAFKEEPHGYIYI